MLFHSILHNRQFRYLGAFYFHLVIQHFALSIFQIFSAIYIYQIFKSFNIPDNYSLFYLALIMALSFISHALTTPFAMWLISKYSLRFTILAGNSFLVIYFILLYFAQFDLFITPLAVIFSGIHIGLYFTAYHIYFTELTDDQNQGQELSMGKVLASIASIGGPAFGGLLISFWGYQAMFLIITILGLLAIIPLKYLPKKDNVVTVNFKNTYLVLTSVKELKSMLAAGSIGIVHATDAFIWPLFAFTIVNGFTGLGFLGSIITFISMATYLVTGFIIDRIGPLKLTKLISPLDSLTWILKFFVTLPWQVFVLSVLSAITIPSQYNSLDTSVYERSRHIDKVSFIIQKEVSLSIFRAVYSLILGVLFLLGMPLYYAFLIPAFFTYLLRLYPQTNFHSKPLDASHK